ncbi:MAG: outer membrane protein assembly factor [Chromatiales bacterium]|nr:MAG: outer membrane protein assembly factor [Chromatiales bacterium]
MPNKLSSRLLLVALLLPPLVSAELAVTGVDGELERNVRAFAAIASEPCDADDRLIRRRYRTLEKEARTALEPFGYYRPAVETSLSRDDDCWRATVTVDPGEPVRLRNVDIRIDGPASTDPVFQELLSATALTPGAVLLHADYDRLKRALQVRAADRGYFKAAYSEHRLDIWPDQGMADVTLHFASGPRYRIGEIQQDQHFIDPAIVLGYLDLEVGAAYDASDIARAYRDLSDSAYFGQIEILPDVENAVGEQVPLRIVLQPANRIEYTVGVGASTDTGPRFRAGFRNNRINTRGHRFFTDLGASEVIQGLTTEYRIPLHDPRREWFSTTAAYSNEETDTFDNEAQRIGVRWTKAMGEKWLRTLSLDASRESFTVGDDRDTTLSIVPAINFDQKRSDRDIFPSHGRRLGIELRGTDESIGSSMSFVQAKVWVRFIRSFGQGNRLLARLNAGVTRSSDFAELPPSIRFFAGGDESIRGFDYDSLGPTDANGDVVGGDNLLVASLEYERHLKGNFYGAVFVDAGNAFNNTDLDAEVGAGIGIKWRSPLGPIRLYLGYPVSDSDKNPRVHLRLGADL